MRWRLGCLRLEEYGPYRSSICGSVVGVVAFTYLVSNCLINAARGNIGTTDANLLQVFNNSLAVHLELFG